MNLKKEILAGKIFIYPTDTIYGIGCNALKKKSVEKIRKIKQRDEKPFSIIAPSFEWIEKNCIVDLNLKKYLPGKYTIILKKKKKKFLFNVSNSDSLGIRIPKKDFTEELQKSGVPFITTSVNISGKRYAKEIKNIPKEILNQVDFVFDAGKISGKPSTIIKDRKKIKR